jgi:CRISPR-associated protein Csd1
MILAALKEVAEREGLIPNPHYEEKAVAYLIALDAEGKFLGLRSLTASQRGKRKAAKKYLLVPRPLPGARRSGTQIDPNFLVHNASFVLGINAPGDKEKERYDPEELAERQAAFRALVCEAEASTGGDPGLQAVRRFLDDLIAGMQQIPGEELKSVKSNELFGFILQSDIDCPVHERPAAAAYWGQRRAEGSSPGAADASFTCLVTNRPCAPVDKHPLIKVPGGTPSGIALVSFNKHTSESYGLERTENAPICREAAEAYTTALARLLDDQYPDPKTRAPMPRRNFRLSEDTVVAYWGRSASSAVDLFGEALREADPEAVGALYSAVWKGRPVNLDDPTEFYALTLSGGQGRATVRGWFASTVRDVLGNVRRHFDDVRIIRPAQEEERPFPLLRLLRCTAVLGKSDNIAPGLASAVFEAVLRGGAYPRLLLDAAVRRGRAERSVYSDRAALIKACLVRAKRLWQGDSFDPSFPEVRPMLDRDCPAPAYRLGRLFAVLEKVQADATNAGTTIRDRFFGAASATPVIAFPQLLRKLPHHLAKLDHAPFYEKLIQQILGAIQPPNPFPVALTLEEQGLFQVGYYHQRQDLFTKRSEAPDGEANNAD